MGIIPTYLHSSTYRDVGTSRFPGRRTLSANVSVQNR